MYFIIYFHYKNIDRVNVCLKAPESKNLTGLGPHPLFLKFLDPPLLLYPPPPPFVEIRWKKTENINK